METSYIFRNNNLILTKELLLFRLLTKELDFGSLSFKIKHNKKTDLKITVMT